MDYSKYLSMPNVCISSDVEAKIEKSANITALPFSELNKILENQNLQNEIGTVKLSDGSFLVAMTCPMPSVTKEMVEWWFWWHPQENVRYQMWYPGEHISISYSKKDSKYFSQRVMPPFQENTQYPVEKIGNMKLPLTINFKTPQNFGFLEKEMNNSGVSIIICGDVGVGKGLFYHTKMAHIFFERDGGLFMVSRFWIGANLKSSFFRKIIANEKTAKDMARHCGVEYRNFAAKIPQLYKEVNGITKVDNFT